MNLNLDSLLALIMPVLVVCIGVAAVKKAISCLVTLAVLLILAILAFGFVSSGAFS